MAGLGEAGILRILSRRFDVIPAAGDWPVGTVGPGDDAAVVAAPDGRFVISTDAMAQDRDFRLDWPASPRRFRGGGFDGGYGTGWKAAAQNLSDINAMGAEATGLLLALTMPPGTDAAWVDGLAAGIAAAARHLGAGRCRIVGGDLGSDSHITLAVTATGDLLGNPPLTRRTGAGQGTDLDLVLCGRTGWAAAGLAVLETPREQLLRGLETVGDPRVRRLAAVAAAAQLRPRPVLDAGRRAHEAGAVAGMDVSDGIHRDTGRLAAANARRVELDPQWVRDRAGALLPVARALTAATRVRTGSAPEPGELAEGWVTDGGEDYGLLAALPAGAAVPPGFERIGRLVPDTGPASRRTTTTGWDHFTGG